MFHLRSNRFYSSKVKETASAVKKSKNASNMKYCLDLIKQYDYENFVCTLLLKSTARSCAIAVRSFNVEVAKVKEQTSDPKIGTMRLQFWEEAVDKCFTKDPSNVPQHPVALQLYKSLMYSRLSKHHFLNLISCRKQYLSQNYFNNLQDLEKYAEKSISSVYYLIFEGMDLRNIHADHAASHLGKAQGITQQLRIVPYAKRFNTIPIPQDLLIKHNLSEEDILRGKPSKNLKECVYEIASRAYQHLMKARSMIQQVPSKGRDALLPAVPVYNYLDQLQKVDYEILHPALQKKSRMWLFHLWITHLRNKY